jgi:hypothetical protein
MTNLAADDLVFRGYLHQDRAHARRAASRVVGLLGRNAIWFTNIEGPWYNGRGWTPGTGRTFIAGVGDDYFAILLQIGEVGGVAWSCGHAPCARTAAPATTIGSTSCPPR